MLRQVLREDTAFRSRVEHPEEFLSRAANNDWIVYAKRPFGGPEQVLGYLSAYTHRIAISESRIIGFEAERVKFFYKDYRDGDREKVMDLDADEFLRRFLLHVLPDRFVRIRHFGFLANRVRSKNLQLAREQLGPAKPQAVDTEHTPTPPRCPQCHIGEMITIEIVPPLPIEGIDSS